MHQYVHHNLSYYSALISKAALVIPAAYHSAKLHVVSPRYGKQMVSMTDPLIVDLDEEAQKGLLTISRGTAILLLGVYIAYLIFQLKTHARLFEPKRSDAPTDVEAHPIQPVVEDVPKMSVVAAGLGYVRLRHSCFLRFKEFSSLLMVTVVTSLVADYREYQVVESAYD